MAYQNSVWILSFPMAFAGRFPNNTTSLLQYRYAFAMLYAADPVTNADAGQVFKRIYTMPSAGFSRNVNVKNPIAAGQIAVNTNNSTTASNPYYTRPF